MEMLATIKAVELNCTEQEDEQNKEVGIFLNIRAEEYLGLSEYGINTKLLEEAKVSGGGFESNIRLKAERFFLKFGTNNGRAAFKVAHKFSDIKFSSVRVNHQEGLGYMLSLRCRIPSTTSFWKWLYGNFRPSLVKLVIEPVQMNIDNMNKEE
jgi:hypothetical protein